MCGNIGRSTCWSLSKWACLADVISKHLHQAVRGIWAIGNFYLERFPKETDQAQHFCLNIKNWRMVDFTDEQAEKFIIALSEFKITSICCHRVRVHRPLDFGRRIGSCWTIQHRLLVQIHRYLRQWSCSGHQQPVGERPSAMICYWNVASSIVKSYDVDIVAIHHSCTIRKIP